ncbi:hypothetical protein SAMN06298216_1604 [Spirosomataceae bacterium TFI 002]|nr:hypothetical protein SAMN06298216_1604 [Spirosomataceae bacterium TFI 002]
MDNSINMKTLSLFVLFCLISSLSFSQNEPFSEVTEVSASDTLNAKLKIYLDCDDCNSAFFRRHLIFSDFVRDAKLADIHVFVTKQKTSGNGTEYGLNFIGLNDYADLKYKLKTISSQDETDIIRWQRLLKIIDAGLLPYLSRTSDFAGVKIHHETPVATKIQIDDPWNFWIFRMDFGSSFSGEKTKKKYSLNSSIKADRITDVYKFKSELSYDLNKNIYKDDDENIVSSKEEAEFNARMIYSISSRWSAGIFQKYYSSTYLNLNKAFYLGPAIEYNIFPWDKSDSKVFTVSYIVKPNYYRYNQQTLFGEIEEWRTSESLKLSLLLRQPWGVIENTLEGSHFFHDFSKNRLALESDTSVRVLKGLFVFANIETELIHDQLYLPAGDITREAMLLQQNKLATNFEMSGKLGVRYTFGSNFNNIVNQRL